MKGRPECPSAGCDLPSGWLLYKRPDVAAMTFDAGSQQAPGSGVLFKENL